MAVCPVVSYFLYSFLHIPPFLAGQTVGLIEDHMILLSGDILLQSVLRQGDHGQRFRCHLSAAFLQSSMKGRKIQIRRPSEQTGLRRTAQTGEANDADHRICTGIKNRFARPGNFDRKPPGAISLAENPFRDSMDMFQKKRGKVKPIWERGRYFDRWRYRKN